MPLDVEISLFGELRVTVAGADVPLPQSKKARALLAYLAATDRPHRRERICELFWDLPDDPKAALRWALSKLRKVIDSPDRTRIVADRERVQFDGQDVDIDLRRIHSRLGDRDAPLTVVELLGMAEKLEKVLLDGLDGAGSESFDAWLTAEREDAHGARTFVVRQLATHGDLAPASKERWLRAWKQLDPNGAEAHLKAETRPADLHVTAASVGKNTKHAVDSGSKAASMTSRALEPVRQAFGPRSRALRAQRIDFCEVPDGTKIALATMGSGPPLLKAANWLNHLEFDWDSPIWGKTFASIARQRTFVRYDERGCGLSDWNVADLSFAAFVEDLEAVANKIGFAKFPLLGISQGCAVSIEYAVRHPDRVTGLILVSGYAAGWRISATPEEQARREAVRTLTEVGWGTDNPAYRHIFSQTFMPDANAEELAWFDEFQRKTTSPQNAARFQDAFGYIDVRDKLAKVSVPTIVLHSKYDQRIPLDQGRSLASAIPNARFVPLESRNHILVDHEPAWHVCMDAVSRFLRENEL